MTYNVQMAGTPGYTDLPFFNYAVTDIPAGCCVKIDAANAIKAANPSIEGIGVLITDTAGDVVVGVTVDIIKASQSGRVRCPAPIAVCLADGTVTANTYVMASGTGTTKKGYVKTQTTGLATAGIALTGAADTEPVLVMLSNGKNA